MSSKETYTLGQLIDSLDRVRDLKRKIQGDIDKCKAKENELQALIIEMASEQGLSKITGGTATASISRSIVPVAVDWDKANKWILRHGETALYQKRLSPVRYRELKEDYPRGIPGLEDHEQVRLNLRKI